MSARPSPTEQVADAAAAFALADDDHRWFGEPVPSGPDPTASLTHRLYLDFYTLGRACPTLDRRFTPAALNRADLVPALEAANASRGCLEPGWRLVGREGDGALVVRRGELQLRVRHRDVEVDPGGEEVRLRLPPGLGERSPGYYMALGGRAPDPRRPAGRIYLSLAPAGAVAAMASITRELDREGIPFMFKALADSSAYSRCDAGVVYVERDDAPAAAALVAAIAGTLEPPLAPRPPALTLRVAAGVGYADGPDGGESFGLHRCRLVAEGLLDAWTDGAPSPATAVQVVARHFADEGLDLTAPHLAAGSRTPVVAEARRRPARGRPRRIDPVEAALIIGLGLHRDAIREDGRASWLAAAVEQRTGRPAPVIRPLGPSLYDGTAGIALFLTELHVATADGDVRELALEAASHAVRSERARGPGLHHGAAGVALGVARAARVLGAEELESAAAALVAAPAISEEHDVVRGTAGTLLGLLALHDGGPEFFAANADRLVDALVDGARRGPDGASWATGRPQDRSGHLLGMAHGASGIALALAAAGAALGRDDARALAHDAAAYERARMSPGVGWPDLRTAGRTGERGPSYTVAWCHGATGIALARIAAWELIGDAQLLADARDALARVADRVAAELEVDGADTCLCHGLAGNAEVLIEGSRRLPAPDERWGRLGRDALEWLASRYVAQRRPLPGVSAGASPGLMTGAAGVGLALLRLADPSLPSVLAPPMTSPADIVRHSRHEEIVHGV